MCALPRVDFGHKIIDLQIIDLQINEIVDLQNNAIIDLQI